MKWKQIGRAGEYAVWFNGEVYQVTKGEVPAGEEGYYHLESLLRFKGIASTFVLDHS